MMGLKKTLKRKKRGGSWLQSKRGIIANRFRKSCGDIEDLHKRFRCKLDNERSFYEAYLEDPYHIYRPDNYNWVMAALNPQQDAHGLAMRQWLNEIRKKKYPNEAQIDESLLKEYEPQIDESLQKKYPNEPQIDELLQKKFNHTKKRKRSDSSI